MTRRLALVALLAAELACVTERERARPLPAPRITALYPDKVEAGRPFNAQPDGSSALSVVGENLFRGSKVRFDGELLETAGGDDHRSLSAIVPKRLTAAAGVCSITVEQGGGTLSNALPFTVIAYLRRP